MFAKEIVGYETEPESSAEMEKASTERKAKIQARVQETKRKLQSKLESSRLHRRREAGGRRQGRVAGKQIASAHEDRKERLRERQARTRAEYQATAKLHEAWELTKSALCLW